MSNIDANSNGTNILLRTRSTNNRDDILGPRRNSEHKRKEIEQATENDVKLDISSMVKDFARIKSAVDRSPELDNSGKIAELREKINGGTYEVDHDALVEKIISSEF